MTPAVYNNIGESELHDELEQSLPQLSFQYLANFRQTPNVIQLQGPKQKYGFGMGYAKKALDLAIRTDKVDEFVNQVKCFIKSTKQNYLNKKKIGFLCVLVIHYGYNIKVDNLIDTDRVANPKKRKQNMLFGV